MYTIEGCLGTTIGSTDDINTAINIVINEIPISEKKVNTMRNALSKLAAGKKYHIEYGGTGCTVHVS